jgi:hypothetical protein
LDNESNAAGQDFYKSIDATPNMNITTSKKSIPLVSELVSDFPAVFQALAFITTFGDGGEHFKLYLSSSH